jgi:catalase
VVGEARQCLRKAKLIEIITEHLDEEIQEKVVHAKFLQVNLPDYFMSSADF